MGSFDPVQKGQPDRIGDRRGTGSGAGRVLRRWGGGRESQVWDCLSGTISQAWTGAGLDAKVWTTGMANLIHFKADSPVYGSIAVNIPQDADLLQFNLSVVDPGNNDHLLVAIGNDVLQDTDWRGANSRRHYFTVVDWRLRGEIDDPNVLHALAFGRE